MKSLSIPLAALFMIVGIAGAGAQNTPNSVTQQPPSSINSSGKIGTKSGSENTHMVGKPSGQIAGNGRYCLEAKSGGDPKCIYATMAACEKALHATAGQCQANTKLGTTGAK